MNSRLKEENCQIIDMMFLFICMFIEKTVYNENEDLRILNVSILNHYLNYVGDVDLVCEGLMNEWCL